MKQLWLRYSTRIDALGLRERVAIFVMLVVLVIALFDTFALEPQFARENELAQQAERDQTQIAQMQGQIQALANSYSKDPDAVKRQQLGALLQKSNQMRGNLRDMQNGLVAPDKMATLLEDILRRNGKLHLVALRTLPVADLLEPEKKDDAKSGTTEAQKKADGAKAPAGSNLVFKHGVEMVIEGNYLDMLDYMQALEGMPWQLFWSKAKLSADDSGKLTLSLTLYTLSLDKNWLTI